MSDMASDCELMARVQEGDAEAFAVLAARHKDWLSPPQCRHRRRHPT